MGLKADNFGRQKIKLGQNKDPHLKILFGTVLQCRDKSCLKDDGPTEVPLDLSIGLAGLEEVEANHIIHIGRHL